MGRGDIKTKKGKIAKGSFGNSRPAKPTKKVVVTTNKEEEEAPKKKVAKKKD